MSITDAMRDGKDGCEARYYILSRDLSARRFAEAVRGHWGIESMHWQLDVTFGEDQSRTRLGHGGANFSVLRRAALGLLKNETTSKVGIKNRRPRAGWDQSYLQKSVIGTMIYGAIALQAEAATLQLDDENFSDPRDVPVGVIVGGVGSDRAVGEGDQVDSHVGLLVVAVDGPRPIGLAEEVPDDFCQPSVGSEIHGLVLGAEYPQAPLEQGL